MKQLYYKYSNITRGCVLSGIILIFGGIIGFFGLLGFIAIPAEEYQIKLVLITIGLILIGLTLFQIGIGRASREINQSTKRRIIELEKK